MGENGEIADGLAAAVDTLAAEGALAPPGDVEPELELGKLADPLPTPAGRRGPGRPGGARNRATDWWRARLLQYGSPLERLAQIVAASVPDLKAELGCTLLEAVKLQIAAAEKLAPYVHSKMPIEIDANGALIAPLLIVQDGGAVAALAGVGGDASTFALNPPVIENDAKSDT